MTNAHTTGAEILLTGFEPFGPHAVNSSWEAVSLLQSVPGTTVRRLPVDHERAAAGITALLDQLRPRIVILCGLAAKADRLRLETQARKPPALGVRDGPDHLSGHWPFEESLAALAAADLPAGLSDDAGQYVCETTYWAALDQCRRPPAPVRIVFLHLPDLSDLWPKARLAQAVSTLIGVARDPGSHGG